MTTGAAATDGNEQLVALSWHNIRTFVEHNNDAGDAPSIYQIHIDDQGRLTSHRSSDFIRIVKLICTYIADLFRSLPFIRCCECIQRTLRERTARQDEIRLVLAQATGIIAVWLQRPDLDSLTGEQETLIDQFNEILEHLPQAHGCIHNLQTRAGWGVGGVGDMSYLHIPDAGDFPDGTSPSSSLPDELVARLLAQQTGDGSLPSHGALDLMNDDALLARRLDQEYNSTANGFLPSHATAGLTDHDEQLARSLAQGDQNGPLPSNGFHPSPQGNVTDEELRQIAAMEYQEKYGVPPPDRPITHTLLTPATFAANGLQPAPRGNLTEFTPEQIAQAQAFLTQNNIDLTAGITDAQYRQLEALLTQNGNTLPPEDDPEDGVTLDELERIAMMESGSQQDTPHSVDPASAPLLPESHVDTASTPSLPPPSAPPPPAPYAGPAEPLTNLVFTCFTIMDMQLAMDEYQSLVQLQWQACERYADYTREQMIEFDQTIVGWKRRPYFIRGLEIKDLYAIRHNIFNTLLRPFMSACREAAETPPYASPALPEYPQGDARQFVEQYTYSIGNGLHRHFEEMLPYAFADDQTHAEQAQAFINLLSEMLQSTQNDLADITGRIEVLRKALEENNEEVLKAECSKVARSYLMALPLSE